MERIFKDLINVGGNSVPVIPMISDNSLCAHPAYANLPLSKQVDILATMLKREDYSQVVLLKEKVDNGLAILNVARMFKDEDVEVVGVCCLQITKEAYGIVTRNLKYGVGDGLQYMIDSEESNKKRLH